MKLRFNSGAICAVEQTTGKSLYEIVAELEAEEGASLSTLRTLLIGGLAGVKFPAQPIALFPLLEMEADKLLDQHGTSVIAETVGKALREGIEKVVR